MSLVLSYAAKCSDIPPFSYKGANDASKQFEISEMYRTARVSCFFKRVEEKYVERGERMTEGVVTRDITLTRHGIVSNADNEAGGIIERGRQ